MRRLAVFLSLLAAGLDGATYYVSSAGNDGHTPAQAQSPGTPWLSLGHAINTIACGDTVIVVANGSYVVGDANLPYFPGCGSVTTVQSSNLGLFAPIGYRTNPANDSANYGKLQFTGQGIDAMPETHQAAGCSINAISGTTLTTGYCYLSSLTSEMTVGSQIEFETNNQGTPNLSATLPVPLNQLQIYYVVTCQSCGTAGGTLQVAATPGGPPISVTCNGSCVLGAANMYLTLQVSTSANTITILDNFSQISNGTPIIFNSVGIQIDTLTNPASTLPAPLQINTIYYPVNISGRAMQVAATPGGAPIALTSLGTGEVLFSSVLAPNNWAFRGLELVEKSGSVIYNLFLFGSGSEAGPLGMVSHMEVDRCWLHDNPSDVSGPNRGVADNGLFINVHDSYIAGMRFSEAQAIAGWASPGPTTITNNFLEAAGENTLYGGNYNGSGVANANKKFIGNYYYKPPVWKTTSSSGPASGACWYDTTDPNHAGGEWYTDSSANQNYQCTSSGVWAATSSAIPNIGNPVFKDLAEHKNGQFFTYTGNLMNYSWAQAQSGEAFNNNQEEGSGPGIANDHIIIQNNKIANIYQFAVLGSNCTAVIPCIAPTSNHVTQNNLIIHSLEACGVMFTPSTTCGYNLSETSFGGPPGVSNMSWNHNTYWTGDNWTTGFYKNTPIASYIDQGSSFINYWTFKNSIVSGDFSGDGIGGCPNTFQCYYTNATYNNIVLLNGTASHYTNVGPSNSATNFVFPTSNTTINYVNGTGTLAGDYHLSASSPYSAQNASATLLSDDGTDLGADIDLINMATSGAAAGTPPWDQQAGLRLDLGSTQVVFRYSAPTVAACTATIYRAPARIAANQVASIADTSVNSISNANARELYVSGLQAMTQYWYKLACGAGELMVGTFQTRAAGRAALEFSFDWSSPTAMQYSSSRSMSSPVSLPAATRQFIPVGINSVVYVQEGGAGTITMLIAP